MCSNSEPNYNDHGQWWGFSPKHGWLVHVRDARYRDDKSIVFFRAKDWRRVRVPRSMWGPPDLIFARNYLDALPEDERALRKAELLQIQAEFEEERIVERDEQRRRESQRRRQAEQEERFRQEEAARREAKEKRKLERQIVSVKPSIQEHEITELIHFTQTQHLGSILKSGLLPRDELDQRFSPPPINDPERLDGELTAICCSISFPNYQMFYRFRRLHENVPWCVLSLHTSVLTDFRCLFCIENAAATGAVWNARRRDGKPDALNALFRDISCKRGFIRRIELPIPKCFPTHPQAEVLAYGIIAPRYIQRVYFLNAGQLNWWKKQPQADIDGIPADIRPEYFDKRVDWEFWKSKED